MLGMVNGGGRGFSNDHLLRQLVSVPDPKPTPVRIAFSIARGKRSLVPRPSIT